MPATGGTNSIGTDGLIHGMVPSMVEYLVGDNMMPRCTCWPEPRVEVTEPEMAFSSVARTKRDS